MLYAARAMREASAAPRLAQRVPPSIRDARREPYAVRGRVIRSSILQSRPVPPGFHNARLAEHKRLLLAEEGNDAQHGVEELVYSDRPGTRLRKMSPGGLSPIRIEGNRPLSFLQ